jgi:uncharacterized SAM-binding protein YcdF (DUF218 family)
MLDMTALMDWSRVGELKPVLTALVLPPSGTLLLALAGLLLARRWRTGGPVLTAAAIVLTLALSTEGMALLLARHLQPPVTAAQPQDLKQVQAIVVLGGGVSLETPEYGAPQPSEASLLRLRYGARLARLTGKPLAFAGGIGWAAGHEVTEAAVARRMLQEDYSLPLRWLDDRSRDTAENAQRMAQTAGREGVRRIALVTSAVHMPRAVAAFRRAGFEVVAAPTDFPNASRQPLLQWLPSTDGIALSRAVLRESLARLVAGGY